MVGPRVWKRALETVHLDILPGKPVVPHVESAHLYRDLSSPLQRRLPSVWKRTFETVHLDILPGKRQFPAPLFYMLEVL